MQKIEAMGKTPLLNLGSKAARMGVASTTFRVSQNEAKRIRKAESQGGHVAGLAMVLQILKERRK